MDTQNNSNSEVARFLQQWDEEVEAILLGLHGVAVTARHDFITHRTQAFGDKHRTYLMTLLAQQKAEKTASPDTTS